MSCYSCNPKIKKKIDKHLKAIYDLELKFSSDLPKKERKRLKRSIKLIENKIKEIDPTWTRYLKYRT